MLITIQELIILEGSDGNSRAFQANTQYTWIETENRQVYCVGCIGDQKYVAHYKFTCDDIDYWVSSEYSLLTTTTISVEDQCRRTSVENRYMDQTADVEPLYKKLVPGFTTMKRSYTREYRDRVPTVSDGRGFKKKQVEKNPGKNV